MKYFAKICLLGVLLSFCACDEPYTWLDWHPLPELVGQWKVVNGDWTIEITPTTIELGIYEARWEYTIVDSVLHVERLNEWKHSTLRRDACKFMLNNDTLFIDRISKTAGWFYMEETFIRIKE